MTFENDTVQHLFHELPTQTQLDYIEYEQKLQEDERQLHILAVQNGKPLQIIVRITN